MIKNDLKIRQVCLLFAALMPVTKIILLPSVLAGFVSEQIYIPLIINFLVDILILYFILLLAKRYPQMTFFEILQLNVGKFWAKTIIFFLGLFFFIKSIYPIVEQKVFVDSTLYEVFQNIISFLPLFVFTAYSAVKGLKSIGRCAEFCVWFTALALLLTIIFSFSSGDYSNLMPIIQKPSNNTVKASFSSIGWFLDSSYMLMFLGHFENEKKQNVKIISAFSIPAFLIVVIFIIFYAVFGSIAKTQLFAVSSMTLHTTKIINMGRFDFLTVFLLLYSSIFAVALPICFSAKCFEFSFNLKKSLYPSIALNVILGVIVMFYGEKLLYLLSFTQRYFNPFLLLIGCALPVFSILFLRRKPTNEKV